MDRMIRGYEYAHSLVTNMAANRTATMNATDHGIALSGDGRSSKCTRVMDNMLATFEVKKDAKDTTNLKVRYIPFVPGLIRIADATMALFKNVIALLFKDIGAGVFKAICRRDISGLKNIPARLILIIRNVFHAAAGAALTIPAVGGFIAFGVYGINGLLETGIEKLMTRAMKDGLYGISEGSRIKLDTFGWGNFTEKQIATADALGGKVL